MHLIENKQGHNEDIGYHEHPKKQGPCGGCNFTPFILMIALSFHAIFEGLALGLQKDPQIAIDLMIAIVLHKYAEGMSLSISLQRAFQNKERFIMSLMAIFACATPIGVSLGLILANSPDIVVIIFTSLAGGTFLYISCSEVITEEFSLPGGRGFKLMAFLGGAAIITCLWFLDKD